MPSVILPMRVWRGPVVPRDVPRACEYFRVGGGPNHVRWAFRFSRTLTVMGCIGDLQKLVGVDVGGDDDVFGYGEFFETAADVGGEFADGFGAHHEVEAVLVVRFREWCDAGFAEDGVGG